MIKCVACNKDFESYHINNKLCSNECRINQRKKTMKKFNDKKRNSCNLDKLDKLENEEFKDIKGYEGNYKISNKGRIYSRKFQNFVKSRINVNGYYDVSLCDKKHKTFRLHRLIALHFIDNPEDLPMVDHIDRNKLNNKIKNLRWVDAKTNCLNKDCVIKKTGGIYETKTKTKLKNGSIKEYIYHQVQYYENNIKKYKLFKTLPEAQKFHAQSIL
jgi:hypothetical protein